MTVAAAPYWVELLAGARSDEDRAWVLSEVPDDELGYIEDLLGATDSAEPGSPESEPTAATADRTASKQARYSRRKHDEQADIGNLHAVGNPRRRHLCRRNLGLFLQTYFPESTGRGPFSTAHYGVIDAIESCLLGGGWYANAVFREFAKTSISEGAGLWAILNGWRRFGAIFGADEDAAREIVSSILMELNENDRLHEDYPEVCVAFHKLEGKVQRCKSQTFQGDPTYIACVGDKIVLPTIRLERELAAELGIPVDQYGQTLCSGGIITAHGLLSAARGMKHKRPDGTQQRPDFALVDDGETDRSAESPADTNKRLRILRKAIIPLAGQRKKLALVVNGTTIAQGAIMEQLLDPKLNPAWRGRKIPMLKSRATNEKLWLEDYAKLLLTWDRENPEDQKRAAALATAFYVAHRAEMDEGAVATWHTCYAADEGEISAVQHAYNILIEQGPEVFAAECQQEPLRIGSGTDDLKATEIIAKANGMARGTVPLWADRVTIMHDVQDDALYWLALATGPGFSGHVLDYGIWPEQGTLSLAYKDVRKRLRDFYKSQVEGGILAGIKDLCGANAGRVWHRQDGTQLTTLLSGVDAADNTTVVYSAVRNAGVANLLPTRGRGVTAKQAPWIEFKDKAGEELDREYRWSFGPTAGSRELRVFQYDTNYWKSFIMKRLKTATGDPGSLTLFGQPYEHVQFAAHVLSEFGTEVSANSRKVMEWGLRPGQHDNHLLDVLVGAHVLAARAGATLTGIEAPKPKERKRFEMPGKGGSVGF